MQKRKGAISAIFRKLYFEFLLTAIPQIFTIILIAISFLGKPYAPLLVQHVLVLLQAENIVCLYILSWFIDISVIISLAILLFYAAYDLIKKFNNFKSNNYLTNFFLWIFGILLIVSLGTLLFIYEHFIFEKE